jgi:hypothetical protein
MINYLFDQLKDTKIFLKIDLGSRCHRVRIKEEDIKKTSFKTRYGNYEFTVVPFGLSNAPDCFYVLNEWCFSGIFRQVCHCFWMTFLYIPSRKKIMSII